MPRLLLRLKMMLLMLLLMMLKPRRVMGMMVLRRCGIRRGGVLLLLLLLHFVQLRGGDGGGGDAKDRQGFLRVTGLRRISGCSVCPATVATAVATPRVGVPQQNLFTGDWETADNGVFNPCFGDFILRFTRIIRRPPQIL